MKKNLFFLVALIAVAITWKFLVMGYFDRIPPINETTKTCLITGASSGIGYNMAREMIKRGWKVIGIARKQDKLQEIAKELGANFIPYVCDVSDRESVKRVSTQIKEQQLHPTLFFLNAGMAELEELYQPMLSIHQETFDTNYFGVVAWVDGWLNDVKNTGGGTFVATSSVSSLWAGPKAASYGASKAAINACFRALHLQYRNEGIGFVIVLPGPVKTDMLKGSVKDLPFIHKPDAEAKYIIKKVFARQKQIEPSWFYSWLTRTLNVLPDGLASKF